MLNQRKRAYLSGKMSGLPDFNFAAFNATADRLRELGYDVENPAEHFAGRTDLPRSTYMRADITALLTCDMVFVIPGWETSKGATLEIAIAREIGLPVLCSETLKELPC